MSNIATTKDFVTKDISHFLDSNNYEEWKVFRDKIDSLFNYKEICKIKQVIRNDDALYLFYDESKIELIEKTLKKIYNNQEDKEKGKPPFDLGYQEPSIYKYEFLGKIYKIIYLWFDGGVDFAISAEEEINKLISLQK